MTLLSFGSINCRRHSIMSGSLAGNNTLQSPVCLNVLRGTRCASVITPAARTGVRPAAYQSLRTERDVLTVRVNLFGANRFPGGNRREISLYAEMMWP